MGPEPAPLAQASPTSVPKECFLLAGVRLDWPLHASVSTGTWVDILGVFNVICVHVTEHDLVLCLLLSLLSLCVCVCVYKCYACKRNHPEMSRVVTWSVFKKCVTSACPIIDDTD